MKSFILFSIFCLPLLCAGELPSIFQGLLVQDKPVKAQVTAVIPPKELDIYIKKIDEAIRKQPEWFRQFSSQSIPGEPLRYDEKLGLTQEEYNQYLQLWGKREFKVLAELMIVLRQNYAGTWSIQGTDQAARLATIRYSEQDQTFVSPNGSMKRIEDIRTSPQHLLGEWNGQEWKYEEKTSLAVTKENLAIGKMAKEPYGIIIYRLQEMTAEGSPLIDRNLLLKFKIESEASKKKK